MPKEFRNVKIVVSGHEVELDVDVDLSIANLDIDMDRVASQMGFWGSVWSAAIEENIFAKAHYRHWRAKMAEMLLAKEPKLSEWKIKVKIEATEEFLKFKRSLSISEKNVAISKNMFASFEKKSNQLQSKGAMSRTEIGAIGMSTPVTPKKRGRPKKSEQREKQQTKIKKIEPVVDDSDQRIQAMKAMFSKKK
jgi:hypothetical protein